MKERYTVVKDWVEDRGLGIAGETLADPIGEFETEQEAFKCLYNYLDNDAIERYTQEDHPYCKQFVCLSIQRDIMVDDEWECDDKYDGIWEYYQDRK